MKSVQDEIVAATNPSQNLISNSIKIVSDTEVLCLLLRKVGVDSKGD